MKSFKVADFKAPLQEFDEATPQPSGTQVLIKVKAAGVCHSDLHIWEGGYDLGHGRKPLSLKDRGINLPLTMGHETVGEILAFGPDVKPTDQGDLTLGDIGLVYPWIGCGKCATCLGGDENMCLTPRSLGRLLRRWLFRSHAGAASTLFAQSQRARSRVGCTLCLLGCHDLQRAEEDRAAL
ncbi:D-arabinose 1-dehydrogenase-like Zn-dependent alcohol dehydrogenase [Bradyrhizobium sp. LM4.3]